MTDQSTTNQPPAQQSQSLVDIYNPRNAKNLTQDQVQAMQNLSVDQIKELAKAFPNTPRGNNYLVLMNKKLTLEKQVFQLSTWPNLLSLRTLNKPEFVAYSFQSIMLLATTNGTNLQAPKSSASPKGVVVDLTKQQAVQATKTETPAGEKAEDVIPPVIVNPQAGENAGAPVIVAPTGAAAVDDTPVDDSEINKALGDATDDISKISPEQLTANPELATAVTELKAAQDDLKQSQDAKAHHMTIKSKEAALTAAQQKVQSLLVTK